MRRLIPFCLALALAGCSSNNASSNNGTVSDAGSDMPRIERDEGSDSVDMHTPDQGTADMRSPQDMRQVDLGAEDAGPDMVDLGTFPDVMAQECFHPSTDPMCPMGEFGPGTFLNAVAIAKQTECCKDFDGDGMVDNKIGQYAAILASQGQDINGQIAIAISYGELIYLLDYSDWSNDTFDRDLTATLYLGDDTDRDFADNLAGNGQFLVQPESFDMNGDPLWRFSSASVNNGKLTAEGGGLQLVFPGLLDQVKLLVTDVSITADVVAGADLQSGGGVSLENGELAGVLDRNLFYESLNEASVACECLAKPVFAYDATNDKWVCEATMTDEQNCQFDPNQGCVFLSDTQSCKFFELVSSDVDVDTDGDGEEDGFSIGVKFTGIGAEITGRKAP